MDCIYNPGPMTTVLVLCLTLIWIIWVFTDRRKKHLMLPPGPPGWPIIGNLLVLFKHPGSSNEDYYFSKCSRVYGDVYKLWIGPQLTYILSNTDHIREVFSHTKIQGRMPSVVYPLGIGPGATGFITASGQEWSVMRRFLQSLFRDLGVGKEVFVGTIQLELEQFVEKLDSFTGEPFWDLYGLLYSAICNITCGILFGHQSDYENPDLKEVIRIIKALGEDLGAAGFVSRSETLLKLPFGPGRKVMTDVAQFTEHVKGRICKAKSLPRSKECVHFVESFLVKMEKSEPCFVENNLVACCLEVFFAGTETTAATLTWAVLFLTTHPFIQAKCQQELDDYVKERGMPRYSDRSKLPYIQAVILETERLASVVPLLLPHLVTEDLHLLGYDFPKETLVIGNAQNTNMDKGKFPEPFDFRPERFLNDGQFESDPDITPFSVGRRACPGEPLARMEIFLFLVSLLHRFTLSPPVDIEMPDYRQGVYGLTRKPLPFAVVLEKR